MKIGDNTKRKKQAAETRNRIYRAVIELMEEKGYDRLKIEDISRRAGVSVGSFYHYFQAKSEILAETLRMADDYYVRVALPSMKESNAGDRIVEFFDYYARFLVHEGIGHARVIYNAHLEFFVARDRPLFKILQEMIATGQKEGTISSIKGPKELTSFLVIGARGVAFDWAVHNGEYDLEEKMHQHMELLVSSLRK